jgi:hypothetical protein
LDDRLKLLDLAEMLSLGDSAFEGVSVALHLSLVFEYFSLEISDLFFILLALPL